MSYQPYGQQPGWPPVPQPQKKARTGLAVGIGVVVVALVVFAVTAFVAPGFLLDDKASSAADDTSCGTGPAADDGMSDGSAQKVNALVSKIIQGFCDQDQDALTQLICTGSEPAIRGYVEEADRVEEFALRGEINDAGPTATAEVRAVLVDGGRRVEADMLITLAYEGDDFCWQDMEES